MGELMFFLQILRSPAASHSARFLFVMLTATFRPFFPSRGNELREGVRPLLHAYSSSTYQVIQLSAIDYSSNQQDILNGLRATN